MSGVKAAMSIETIFWREKPVLADFKMVNYTRSFKVNRGENIEGRNLGPPEGDFQL